MSATPETRPSRRATNPPDSRPAQAMVAKARWVEAKAITDALVVRLSRERSELAAASVDDRTAVERRVQVTRLELTDAQAYERRVFAAWEHERTFAAQRPVAGRTGHGMPQVAHESVSTISSPSERRLRLLPGDEPSPTTTIEAET